MYADRAKRFSPVGAGAALAVNGALIAGLIFAFAPVIVQRITHDPTTLITIPPDAPPPPPIDDTVKPKTDQQQVIQDPYVPPVENPTHSDNTLVGSNIKIETPPVIGPPATGGGEVVHETVAPPPLIAAVVDPRYARDFQPDYPAMEIRSGFEGTVAVRVLIGVDGRVKQVEQVGAGNANFFNATRRQALAHWRFKPATRGGVPQESWKTMTVRFELSGE
jgi:protein TonB